MEHAVHLALAADRKRFVLGFWRLLDLVFEMNKVMRLPAVIRALGLIPAAVGGLFGMNLVDNPWPFTLPQIGFAVSMGMLLALVVFFVKGRVR